MKCEPTRNHLKAYLDRELGWLTRRRVARHLRGCPTCESTVRVMESLTNCIQEYEPMDPPRDFKTRVMARIASEIQRSRREPVHVYRPEHRFTAWAPAYAFLAGAATVVSIAFLQRHITHVSTPTAMQQVSEAQPSRLYELRIRVRVDTLSGLEDGLAEFGPVTRSGAVRGSLCVTLPRRAAPRLEAWLASRGEIFERRYGYSSLKASASLKVYIEPVVE